MLLGSAPESSLAVSLMAKAVINGIVAFTVGLWQSKVRALEVALWFRDTAAVFLVIPLYALTIIKVVVALTERFAVRVLRAL